MDENNTRPPRKEENPVREWVSDNLRYLILIGVIVLIALVVFFIIRNYRRKNKPADPETTVESVSSSSEAASASSEEPEPYAGLVDNPESYTEVIERYFDALNNADADAAALLTEEMTDTDRSDIAAGVYNRSYGNITVYGYDRTEDDCAVVLVQYTYRLPAADVDIPGLTEYCMKNTDAGWKIASEETQRMHKDLLDEVLASQEGKALVESVRSAYEKVMRENPNLADFLP